MFSSPDETKVRHAAKAELRKRLSRIRRALPRDAAAKRDASICAACEALTLEGTVASYLPMRSEIDLKDLHVSLMKNGSLLALPCVEPDAPERLRWRVYRLGDETVMHPLGFAMPTTAAAIVEPETVNWVITPCLAVDTRGFRLGWGGGFYDRALPLLTQATRVAVAYEFQLMAELPNTDGDERVHRIVTDGRSLETRPT